MTLTKKQEEALNIAVARYKKREPYTCIAGYAGTGKSTLVKFIIAALKLNPEVDVFYCTFTGKAATVLRHKGCPNAMTAHKLLYYSKKLPNGKFLFRPKPTLDGFPRLIIVDEISMLPKDLWNLLLRHRVHVIACGDPEQLPPINKDSDNHVLDNPHIFLDQVMRQAEESEIIKLTMAIREGKYIDAYKGTEVQVIDESEVVDGMYHWADQILVATNRARHEINDYMRRALGHLTPEPEVGEKIICCRNAWDVLDTKEEIALVNGTIGYIEDIKAEVIDYEIAGVPEIPVYIINLRTENGEQFEDILIYQSSLLTGEKYLTPQEEYRLSQVAKNNPDMVVPLEFNYGYAITCHRAQGSEWEKVLVFEEGFPFDKTEHRRWLYTACTRPSEKLVLVR